MKLSEILRERGLVHQHSSETLEAITDGNKRTIYLGIDPSADSLHAGNLVGLLVLRHFLEDGHTIIILTGGGTGMIGDPGGKSEERNLLDEKTIAHNTKAVAKQIHQVFGSSDFIEVDNADWLSKLKVLEFLRDVGKHFTVNAMIKKDIVKNRLDAESPISFTEFSYSLLQGYDYLHLNDEYGADVQVGGSDQWSNILAGVEFIRRKAEKEVYALTWPLIVNRSTGKKFGKSEAGAIWLDPKKTSPFQFYQFFLNADDESVEELLLKITLIPYEEVETIMRAQHDNPAGRTAQKELARAVTTLVHGIESSENAENVSDVLFGAKTLGEVSDDARELLAKEAPSAGIKLGISIVDALVEAKLATSKREARQFIEDGAVSLAGAPINDVNQVLEEAHFANGIALLRRGKRNASVLILD
ncbi:tyrosine--tRNA ligase [Candidatus Kaiserbacteria bacterium RIFCSPHIGHO2_01_FULL_56_24]|uniref:Tyrosine--tRNA ligase n=1 Tax=Candidatus Kaiserbacteria bacterium RIFCSPHIGHO2_01_FULL_56_24 TaxID=1798487 RepID=A0A1F6DG29_9BACT|nr:MAG: tyrosine--tRNA ligase [Candidatus Kaiserbacteria bacterium RIFCSPHIGHO2_01_FULL_56_24]